MSSAPPAIVETAEKQAPNASSENGALPSEVTRLRVNWLGWSVPVLLFVLSTLGMIFVRRQHPDVVGPAIALLFVAFAAQIYLSINPHVFEREKLGAGDGTLTIGETKIDRSRLENAVVQPPDPALSWKLIREPYRTRPRVNLIGKKMRDSVSLLVKDEAEGHAILRALAFDPAHATSTFTVRAGLFANDLVRFFLFIVPSFAMPWIVRAPGMFRVALIALVALSYLNTFWPTKLKIGVDGVLIKSLRRSQFYAFSEISRVVSAPRGVALMMSSGKRVEIHTSATLGGNAGSTAETILKRLQEGLAYARKKSGRVELALVRGDLAPREWIDRLRAIGKGQAADYRVAAVEPNELWRVVEDPTARADERIAAAIALRVDDQAASRLRVAASLSASPKVRAALEAAADENEELLERAFDEEERAT